MADVLFCQPEKAPNSENPSPVELGKALSPKPENVLVKHGGGNQPKQLKPYCFACIAPVFCRYATMGSEALMEKSS